MKKAFITLCAIAATLTAGSAFATGANGERGYVNGLYNTVPLANTWQARQAAMTPHAREHSSDALDQSDIQSQSQMNDTQSTTPAPADVN